MAHVRKQLRDYLKPRLEGTPDAGDRVLVRRSLPLSRTMEPTYLLSIENERSADMSMSGSQNREIAVRITGVVKGDQEAGEDALERLAVHAESVFSADPTLGGLAQTYEYQSTEFSTGGEGDKVVSAAALTFAVTVFTDRGDPETAL